jgi:hypothetical protein
MEEHMKKVVFVLILAFVMMPFASFAKTSISDSDLSDVTAQSGVTINFQDLSVQNVTMSIQSWGDSDGFDGYLTSGWVGASMSLAGNVVGLGGTMNIDVGTEAGGQTRLKIDLPSVTIGAGAGLNVDQTIKLSSDKLLSGEQVLGQSYMGGLQATISGSIQIYAH